MPLIPKMPVSEPDNYDALCDIPCDVAEALGVPELDVAQMGFLVYSVDDVEDGGSGWLTKDLRNPYDLDRFDQLESLGLVCDGMERIADWGGDVFQVHYKASFVGRAVVRKVAAWNRLERDKREWKRLHPFIGDPERVESAARFGRDLVMMAVGAVLSRAVDAAISMLP